jgi:hypothetical protein
LVTRGISREMGHNSMRMLTLIFIAHLAFSSGTLRSAG